MKHQLLTLLVLGSVVLLLSACKTTSTSYYSYETECMGVELDGSQTLKAYGVGRYWIDATEQAKKNAVRDVIFKGNYAGSGECQKRPILLEVNAHQKYENYFNVFFRDKGAYAQYVSLRDERIGAHVPLRMARSRNSDQSVYSVIVRVKREELKQTLIRDGILKP